MRKLITVLMACMFIFISCGETKVISIKETIEMSWGSFDLLTGWKYEKINEGIVKLTNIDEKHLVMTFKPIPTPVNFETWSTNQAVSTGRIPVKTTTKKISNQNIDTFISTAKVGKTKVTETLYLFSLGEKSLSVVTTQPIESRMGHHLIQILESIEVMK